MFSKIRFSILGSVILSLFIVMSCSPNRYSQEIVIDQDVLEEADKDANPDVAQVGANQSSKYGWYLVDGGGRTLYMFLADKRYESSDCYGQCAEVWPPLLTSGNPEAVAAVVNSEMLGTIERRDGSMQVTYNGWPLYYYVKDQGEGKFKGQDIKGFGAEWYLMAPSGSYIHQEGGHEEYNMNKQMEDSSYTYNKNKQEDSSYTYNKNNQMEDPGYMNEKSSAAKVGIEKSDRYGAYLTDMKGRTLYIYIDDSRNEASKCYGQCEEVLQPYVTTGAPVAVSGAVNSDLLGTIERRDGTMQVTYSGWPLYYYKEDREPGEMNGLYDTGDEVDKLYLIAPTGNYMQDENNHMQDENNDNYQEGY